MSDMGNDPLKVVGTNHRGETLTVWGDGQGYYLRHSKTTRRRLFLTKGVCLGDPICLSDVEKDFVVKAYSVLVASKNMRDVVSL